MMHNTPHRLALGFALALALPVANADDIRDDITRDYDEQCFWQELVSRLSDRDALHSLTDTDIKDMTPAEYIELTYPFEEKYYDEFEQHGLDNLFLRTTTDG